MRFALAVSGVLLAACGDDASKVPFTCTATDHPPELSLVGYVPRPLDTLSLGVVDGRLAAWVLRFSDEDGRPLAEAVAEVVAVATPDGEPIAAPIEAAWTFRIPEDASRTLVTRIVGRDTGVFTGTERAGPLLTLGEAAFPAGLCALGTDHDDWLELRADGRIAIDAGDGQDALLVAGGEVRVDGGAGNDTIELFARDGEGPWVIRGGPGRDRIVGHVDGADLLGEGDDDCVVPVGHEVALDLGGQDLAAVYRWCGPLAGVDEDAAWDPTARAIEAALLDEIDAARRVGIECRSGHFGPAPVPAHGGEDFEKLRWAARLHVRDMGGYPPPTSPRFAGDVFVIGNVTSFDHS